KVFAGDAVAARVVGTFSGGAKRDLTEQARFTIEPPRVLAASARGALAARAPGAVKLRARVGALQTESVALVVTTAPPLPAAKLSKPNAVAVVAVDKRLHALLATELAAYVKAAEARRRFPIALAVVEGLDDLPPARVRDLLLAWKRADEKLEGVLWVGDVKLPSFFMPRADTLSVRLWPRYLEDLDMVAEKKIAPGTVLEHGEKWPAVGRSEPFLVPEHDFDTCEQGESFGPELWAAFLPVGCKSGDDSYEDWAKQLRPFFAKALAFYARPQDYGRGVYVVSNDLNCL